MSKTIIAGGREIGFRFDVYAWMEVEERFGSLEAMNRAFGGDDKPMGACVDLIRITGNAWMRHMKYPGDLTSEWLREHLSPKQAILAASYAKASVVMGMKRECATDDDEDIDMVLAETKKKKSSEQEPA